MVGDEGTGREGGRERGGGLWGRDMTACLLVYDGKRVRARPGARDHTRMKEERERVGRGRGC
jgi:hypothetical protein